MSRSRRHVTTIPVAATALLAATLTATAVASTGTAASGAAPAAAPAVAPGHLHPLRVGDLEVENSFVSSVGWVKPGEAYPARVVLSNFDADPVGSSTVTIAPVGGTITDVRARGHGDGRGGRHHHLGHHGAGGGRRQVPHGTLVLRAVPPPPTLPMIVWKDLSATAVLTSSGQTATATAPR